jgi:hypothetical protein
MNINKIPDNILKDLRERCSDEEIKGCSAEYLFNEYCMWHGLGLWGGQLITALDALRAAEKECGFNAGRVAGAYYSGIQYAPQLSEWKTTGALIYT